MSENKSEAVFVKTAAIRKMLGGISYVALMGLVRDQILPAPFKLNENYFVWDRAAVEEAIRKRQLPRQAV